MSEVTEKVLGEVVMAMSKGFDRELYAKTRDQLEEHWYFKFDPAQSQERNLYEFIDMMDLYSSFCRRWEEHHNGISCVVGRVRDRYIMPKIREFLKQLNKQTEGTDDE